jgi:ERCC4-related helicase
VRLHLLGTTLRHSSWGMDGSVSAASVTGTCIERTSSLPLLFCRIFVGQGESKASGGVRMSQKEQKATLEDFRAYKFNTLVATCIGEEGLDIPDVDLIVCLDVSASPTRSVQRMGRTGRHRKGRVVYILSQGKEEQKYQDGLKVILCKFLYISPSRPF